MDTREQSRRETIGIFGSGLVAAAIVALGVPWMAEAQAPVAIESSHVLAVGMPKGDAENFDGLAERRFAGELGTLQLGSVHMTAPALARSVALGVREFEPFGLPYMFEHPEALQR